MDGEGATGGKYRDSALVTLVLIPIMIVITWLLENYLLAGTTHLFTTANFPVLVAYTVVSSVLVGIVVPVMRIRAGFLSGAVNMFQIGFRSARRTAAAAGITALAIYTVLTVTGAATMSWVQGAALFLLVIPTSIATVMLCWVLAGTHVQAYVRGGGAVISILCGTLVTALLFAISVSVLFASGNFQEIFPEFFVIGCVSALFFFAVRDVYASVLVIASFLSIFLAPYIDPRYIVSVSPIVAFCGIFAFIILAGAHSHFSRHYTTVVLPEK